MANQGNQKKQKKKTKKQQRQQQQRQVGLPKVSREAFMGFVMRACSIVNPFCAEAIAARWPDESFSRSVGWSAAGVTVTVSSDANGCLARLFIGDKDYQTNVPASITAPTITYAANNTAIGGITMPANIARQRVTCWGIKVSCIAPALTASGTCRIRLFSPMGGSTLASVSGVTTMADAMIDIPLSKLIKEPIFVVPAPLGITARTFQAPAIQAAIANWVNNGWQVVQVYVDGAPASTPCIEVAYFCHYEFVFADGDASAAFNQPPPPNQLAVREASQSMFEKVGNFIEGSVSKVDKLFQSKGFQYAVSAGLGYATGGASGAGMAMLANVPRRPALMVD